MSAKLCFAESTIKMCFQPTKLLEITDSKTPFRGPLTRGVVITNVDDLLHTGWQHHIDAITKALLAKYVIKKSGSLPYRETGEVLNDASEGIDFLGARLSRC